MRTSPVPAPDPSLNFHDPAVNNLFAELEPEQRYSLLQQLNLRGTIEKYPGLQLKHIDLGNGRSEILMRTNDRYVGAFQVKQDDDGSVSFQQYRVAEKLSESSFDGTEKNQISGNVRSGSKGEAQDWLDKAKDYFFDDEPTGGGKKLKPQDTGAKHSYDLRLGAKYEEKHMHVDQTWGSIETNGKGYAISRETNVYGGSISATGGIGMSRDEKTEFEAALAAELKINGPELKFKGTYVLPAQYDDDGKLKQSWGELEVGASSGLQAEMKYGMIDNVFKAELKRVIGVGGTFGVGIGYESELQTQFGDTPPTPPPSRPALSTIGETPEGTLPVEIPDSTELVLGPKDVDVDGNLPTANDSALKNDFPGPDFNDLPERDQQALNRIADEKFHEEHPELDGKPLGKDAPPELKEEWMRQREDAYDRSKEYTATDEAYRKHYEDLGITPPDKIDPNNPEHAEFQKTWNEINDGITGVGAQGASAELQAALAKLIADTRAKLEALDDETAEELGKIEGLVTDIGGIAEKAEAAKNSAERSLAQAEEAVHG